ncbi:MAG TPA: hypothetical protein VHS80_10525, partial [Chthoniobacterales bacterium]|nr:hypothetical protein [Chthoniobacterales bacterium]
RRSAFGVRRQSEARSAAGGPGRTRPTCLRFAPHSYAKRATRSGYLLPAFVRNFPFSEWLKHLIKLFWLRVGVNF